MTTEITQDFDPNLDIPGELKNTRISVNPDVVQNNPDPEAIEEDSIEDLVGDDEIPDDTDDADNLGVPESFTIISQVVRTGLDGTQVVDVVIDVDEVPGASNYEIRMTK